MYFKASHRLPTFILMLTIISFQTVAQAPSKRGMVPIDYFDFVFVGSPSISPDGSKIIFAKTSVNDDASGRHSHLYLIERNQPPRRFTQGDKDRSAKWSPDGKSIAFVRSVDDTPQVFIIPANGGEATQITELEDFMTEFQWLPDNQGLLLSLEGEQVEGEQATDKSDTTDEEATRAEPDIVVVQHARYMANSLGFLNDKRIHLHTLDIPSKTLTQITRSEDYNVRSPQVSPDGKYVFYSANKTGTEFNGSAISDIYKVELATKTTTRVTEHPHAEYQSAISHDGKRIAYLHNEAEYTQTDLWLMDSDGKGAKNLTKDFDRNATRAAWSPSNKALYFIASDHGAERIFSVNTESGTVNALLEVDKTQSSLTLSPAGDYAVFAMESSTELPELYRYDFETQNLTQLTQFNQDVLARLHLSEAKSVWFKNDKGMNVQGFLHLPVGYEKGESYPLVLNIKGGPGGMWGHRWFHENQMYAAKGYGVAYVNYRGSSGYGFDHANAVRLDYGGADYQDNMQFLEHVIAQNDWIDVDQLFITGGSHGGFLSNWITTQTSQFKAAVTQRSVSSWISAAGTQQYTPYQMRSEFGGSLWENFDYYWDRSPLQFADKVTTPTLIIHSDGDTITPIGQGQEWFYALKANDVPTEMVIFKGENHNLSRTGTPTNLVERLERILEWFERYSK
jgi:dipeptidyl aminopeptidase/acylaminoacyl peptidase